MSGNSCTYKPKAPNGAASRTYQDLVKRTADRPQANLIYADYVTSNMADVMDQNNIKRNSQGEHNAGDILKFIDYSTWLSESGKIHTLELQIGATDSSGVKIDYDKAEDAMKIAEDFNNNHKGVVAQVVRHGRQGNAYNGVYNIVLSKRSANTHMQPLDITAKMKIWDMHKSMFNAVGIDIENLPLEVEFMFSPFNANLAQSLMGLQNIQIDDLYKENALVLFHANANSAPVQTLVQSFGSINDAAQALADFNHGARNLTRQQMREILAAVNHCKRFNGIDLHAMKAQESQMSDQIIQASPEEKVRDTLHRLHKKYNIGIDEVHRNADRAESLSQAAADAALTLRRKIRKIERTEGATLEAKRLTNILNKILKELHCKKYYAGMIDFLGEANAEIAEAERMLNNIPNTGNELEDAFKTARILQDIRDIRDRYYLTVDALADEHTTIDEAISQTDINNVRSLASNIKKFFDNQMKMIKDLEKETMQSLLKEIIGDTTPDGISIENAIAMAEQDSSIMDWLYSVGRASNPIIASMGYIIRNAQSQRDSIMNSIALRIRRATDALYKAGFDSKFMYEDDGHIISDIDWQAYEDARTQEIKSLYRQGLRDIDLKIAIEDWEERNTEDRLVDTENDRYERVPNSSYRKAFPSLTKAQKDYYETMMQIKGEIGTLLPEFARHHFLPAQLRRNMLDALTAAKGFKDVQKALKNKVENIWVIREDDDNYHMNGIIDGQSYEVAPGEFDNTPLREIPIFFINKLKDQNELLLDFSAGIQALAMTAINYNTMSQVQQVVEFMGDFVKSKKPRDPKNRSEVIENSFVKVVKDLINWSKTNGTTADLVEGFLQQHLYLQKFDEKENPKISKIVGKLIGYTSFKNLSTNLPGAVGNYLMGEFQMMIEAGAGEFYGFKDYLWAHKKLFGFAGAAGEIAELLTNNVNHKGVLMRELFDPLNENFTTKGHTRYYKSPFRQLLSHDCSFIGYSSGEYLIHYVNMYAVLHKEKILLNGKKTSLYDAFEVVKGEDNNSELVVKQGATTLDGNEISPEWLELVRRKIRYVNQTTHGAMNAEDKGLLHRKWWGRCVMNFRQWMVEHYSRRFRRRHFDASLKMDREGYYETLRIGLWNDDTKDLWEQKRYLAAIGDMAKDFLTFMFRSDVKWNDLDEMQKANIHRVRTEFSVYFMLMGLSFVLGEPDDHKREAMTVWWMFQIRRALREFEASMPHPRAPMSALQILKRPAAGIDTLNGFLYILYGLINGDIGKEVQSGKHKGENVYFKNVSQATLPFLKDIERFNQFGETTTMFKMFEDSPNAR